MDEPHSVPPKWLIPPIYESEMPLELMLSEEDLEAMDGDFG